MPNLCEINNNKTLPMKIIIRLLTFSIFVCFLFISCEGPMGPAGADGKDINSVCLKCHNKANFDAKEAQYDLSDKGERGARTGKYCARCHTTEGFKEILTMGTFTVSNEMLNGTKLGCSTCHNHSSFDFSGDTVSQVLRTIDPVYTNFNNYNF